MGIKDLWTILTPFYERKPLFELEGKYVGVDLSGWVCQAQCIAEYDVQPRMYLRTCYLLLNGIYPIFVLEGEAPSLKHKTIAARNANHFKGAKPRKEGELKTGKGRTRFHFILKQCETMLNLMGVTCVTGKGEAEAMCAYLNEAGFIDGCISQDSDCFAYGAQVVYRNFSISQQGEAAASGGSIDIYNIQKAKNAIDFGRNKVIALALFCGSDYNKGVHGVGKDKLLKFFETIKDTDVIDYIKTWKSNKIPVGRNVDKNEHAIRKKAIADPEFPDEDLMNEFLNRKDYVDSLDTKWKCPDLKKFLDFTVKFIDWEPLYAFEKIFPILTRWIMLNHNEKEKIRPARIKKRRKPKGVDCYEIVWESEMLRDILAMMKSDEVIDCEKLMSSIEPVHLVERRFPDLVHEFESSKKKPVKKTTRKKAKVAKIDQFLDSSTFGDEDNSDLDMSGIIDDIVSRPLPSIVQEKLQQIRAKVDMNVSNFYINQGDDPAEDLFEKTFNEMNRIESDSESNEHDDTFEINNTPLLDRVKKRLNKLK